MPIGICSVGLIPRQLYISTSVVRVNVQTILFPSHHYTHKDTPRDPSTRRVGPLDSYSSRIP